MKMEYHVEALLRGNMFMDVLEARCADVMEKYGLRRVDTEVISYLYNNQDRNTAVDIGRFLNRNKGYISQVVDRLCKEEYIVAVPDLTDRRYVHYVVCPKSKEVAEDVQKVWDEFARELFDGISEEERETFRNVAAKLRDNMMRMKV